MRRVVSRSALILALLAVALPMSLAATRIDLLAKLARAAELMAADPADIWIALRTLFFRPVEVSIGGGLAIFAATSALMAGRCVIHGDDALGDPVPEYRLYDWRQQRWRSIMPAMAVTTVLVLIVVAAGIASAVPIALSHGWTPGPPPGSIEPIQYPLAMWTGLTHAAVALVLIISPWLFFGRARRPALLEFGWLLHLQLATVLALLAMLLFITTGYTY